MNIKVDVKCRLTNDRDLGRVVCMIKLCNFNTLFFQSLCWICVCDEVFFNDALECRPVSRVDQGGGGR